MKKQLYHHGDLRAEMIKKGIQLLNKEGYEGFSLRKIASMCNVSHTAPYRHFKNKNELYKTIGQEIHSKFKEAMLDGREGCESDPRKHLLNMCKQYVSFMVNNPEYFRYIFITVHGHEISVSPEDIRFEEEGHLFNVSKKCAKEYFEQFYGNDSADWVLGFLALWSMIHGLTLLLVTRTIHFQGDYLAYAEKMIEAHLDHFENSFLIKL